MEELIRQAEVVAKTGLSVLIEGETGTGKEMFAQGIHNASRRRRSSYLGPKEFCRLFIRASSFSLSRAGEAFAGGS